MDSSYPQDLPSEEQHGDPSTLPKSVDKSEALFSMYLERSDEDDRKTAERWKGESDAILIFTGLFSAALAALISVSIQGLQPNSQDISAFYLRNIYHVLANSTTSQPIVLPTPFDPPIFSPPKSAVLVNSLWFLSLLMSLTGALIAVFIQQWAQSYLHVTQGRHNPRDRARIRTFHAEGLEELYLHRVTRAVPILIHASLFLFFSGLPVFLFNVNRTVFNVVVTWLALCVAGYACITLLPVFCQNSPYHSPLSSSVWWCVNNTLFIFYRLLKKFTSRDSSVFRWYDTRYARSHLCWPSFRAVQKAAGRFALKLPSDIDYRALLWMFNTLNSDDEFEQFFDALPSLCDSEELVDAQSAFIKPNEKILSHALIGMMDRTLLSDLVPEWVRQRRIIICTKAIGATSLLGPWWTLHRILCGDWHGFSRSIYFGLFVQGWEVISHPVTAFYAQYVVAVTLATVQERGEDWFQLASLQLNESISLLWNYFARDDSILLADAIFIIRRTIQTFSASENRHKLDIFAISSESLELICRFDIQNTLPEHQHQFCSLWNQLVDAAQTTADPQVKSLCLLMLKCIRRLYISLHEKTSSSPTAFSTTTKDGNQVLNDAGSYPRCRLDEHRHSLPVPELQLDARSAIQATTSSTDVISALHPTFVPVLPPTFTTPLPFGFPSSPSVAVVSNPFRSVAPGPFIPEPYSDSATPPSPLAGLSPTVSITQASPLGRDPLAASGEVASRQNAHVRFSPSASTSTSSSSVIPSPQGSPDSATIHMPTSLPAGSMPFVDASTSTPKTPRVAPVTLPIQVTPMMTAPSADSWSVLIPTPSLGVGDSGVMTPILKIYDDGDYSGLLCHSPHNVMFEEDLYPTALHLFEARKFSDHRPDLADRIRACERVEGVAAIRAEQAEFTRQDWGHVALSTIDDVLYLKFRQHDDLHALLLSTYPAKLVFVEPEDPFWGDGAGMGMNELGKSLARVRKRLRVEAGM